jgi:hypothetical protein
MAGATARAGGGNAPRWHRPEKPTWRSEGAIGFEAARGRAVLLALEPTQVVSPSR